MTSLLMINAVGYMDADEEDDNPTNALNFDLYEWNASKGG
jgi:hypothetical protein